MLGWGQNWEKNDEKKLLCRLYEFEFTLSRFVCLDSYLCILFLSVGSTPLAASLYTIKIKVYFALKTTSAFCSRALRRGGRGMRE